MNEEPKSIWKKSWKGWGLFGVWLVIVGATFLVLLAFAFWQQSGPSFNWLLALFYMLLVGAMVSTIFLLLWFFIRWLCCWKNFRRFLFVCACLATLIALAYAEEDWRGWHDWNQFKRQQEAKGEKLDFKDFVPPPVPDSENFAMAPIWVELIGEMNTNAAQIWYGKILPAPERTNLAGALSLNIYADINSSNWPTNGSWLKATMTDLKPWQDYYRAATNQFSRTPRPQSPAQDVLLALSKYDSTIAALREAGRLPYSRFPVEYDKDNPAMILLPHLAVLKRSAQVLQLRAGAELQNGQTDKAFDDVKLSLRLMGAIQSEPFIISQLVRFAMLHITMQPIYEGLAQHKWSDAQLADLDGELAKLDFLADFEFCIHAEPAAHIKLIDYLEQKRKRWSELEAIIGYNEDQNVKANFCTMLTFYLAPKGWFHQNEIALAQLHQKWNDPMVNDAGHIVSPKIVAQGDAAELNLRPTPFNFFERLESFSLGAFAQKAAYAQNAVDLARVAIALERYRLASGGYPDSLDAVAAQFPNGTPHDIINGQPLHYRLTANGQFVMYSVGWNETDDGGMVGLTQSGSVDNRKGDWVWRYPQK